MTPPLDIVNNIQEINWSIVAEKVSDQSSIKRTPEECRIQWVGNLHPKVNHGGWTQEELDRLHDLTANELATGGKINWARVAQDLGTNRIPIDCMKQATTKPRHHWDTLNDQKLREAVQLFGTNNWNLVARHVSPYATTSQCQTRYVRSVDPKIKRGTWSSEEDERLRKAVAVFGNSWIDVAGVLPGRTNEQCRERWGEVSSNRGGKGDWSPEEDQQLLDLVKELGNKWKAISAKIGGGRTGPHCRIRYDKLIRMRAKQAEEAVAVAALGVGPSQVPLPTIPAIPPVTTPRGADVPAPVTAQLKLQRGKNPKTVKVPVAEEDREPTASTRDESTRGQPQESAKTILPNRPRPRPRPAGKSKGKERATHEVTPDMGLVASEQSTTSTDQPPIPLEAERHLTEAQLQVQPEAQQPVTRTGAATSASPSHGGTVTSSQPEVTQNESPPVAQPSPYVSTGNGERTQEQIDAIETDTTNRDENIKQSEGGKRKRDDSGKGIEDESTSNATSPRRSLRKKQKVVANSGAETQSEASSSQARTQYGAQQPTEGKSANEDQTTVEITDRKSVV